MASIGERAPLLIRREIPHGLLLDGGGLGEVLLPRGEVPHGWQPGTTIDVFLYRDSEDRPVATLREPLVMPGGFARLKCTDVTPVGAFLDWGLPKELLVPFREQKAPMEVGKSYIVRVLVDGHTGRVVATTRLARHLDLTPPPWAPGDAVELMLYGKTELGYKAIIEGTHSGLIFANQVFQDLRAGQKLTGYIREIRSDRKIDLTLLPPAHRRVADLESRLTQEITARGGLLPFGDHTPAEDIRAAFGVSKRTFKQTLGALLKKRRITIGTDGVRLASPDRDWSPPAK